MKLLSFFRIKIFGITLLTFTILSLNNLSVYSQVGAAINSTGVAPHSSAMLDVSSDNSGILIPRMTEFQKFSITNPALGLMIFQTDGSAGLWYFDGNNWQQSTGTPGATGATGAQGADGILTPGSSIGNTPYWDGSQWVVNSSNIFNNGSSVSIGTITPEASALFELNSSTKGTLITRMTTTDRNNIANPAQGLQIYNTTTKCFEYFEYGVWQTWHCATCPLPIMAGNINGSTSVCLGDNSIAYSVPAITNATSYTWTYTGSGVTINGTTNSVTLDFAANATSGILNVKGVNDCGEGTTSANLNITVNTIPTYPTEGVHSASKTEIHWNWNSVSGANGYKYNTINDYNSATDNGISTDYLQSGLICNSSYTLYVWAYGDCGYSAAATLTGSTTVCWVCGDPLTINHSAGSTAPVNKTVNYGTVSTAIGGTGTKCWITQNLGASNQATASSDPTEEAAGWYWQFNKMQGYKHDGSTRTPNTSWTNSFSESSNWIAANDPCTIELGSGWRVPTSAEWIAADGSPQNWATPNDTYNSVLKMHLGGYLNSNDGSLTSRGSNGPFWTGTQSSSSEAFYLSSSSSSVIGISKSYGFSTRCIKD